MMSPAMRSRASHRPAMATANSATMTSATRGQRRRRPGANAVSAAPTSLSASAIDPHLRVPSAKGNAWMNNAMAGERLPKAEVEGAGPAGHRARLRQRLLAGGAEALADYKVLEYLLFASNPRGDTKPLAKALLARFGSLNAVFNAEPGALTQFAGMG